MIRTLGDLFLDVERHGSAPFLSWVPRSAEERTISYADFVSRAQLVATTVDRHASPGGIVALIGAPTPEWYIAFAGIQISGRVAAPLNHLYAPGELEAILAALGAELVMAGPGLRLDTCRMLSERSAEVRLSIDAYADDADPVVANRNRRSPGDPAVILHTSGTTGRPKAAVQSHENYIGFVNWYARSTMVERERVITYLAPCHQAGLLLSFIAPIVQAGHITQLERFSPELFWDAVRRHGCTWCVLIPPAPARLLAQPPTPDDRCHTLRRALGNNTSEHDRLALADRFGIIFTHEQLGSTETTLYSLDGSVERTTPVPPSGFGAPGSGMCGGRSVPGWSSIRIVGHDGEGVPPGTRGEIQVSGPGVFLGYLHDEEQTRRAFTPDGWYRTGDIGYRDVAGFVYWVDRMHGMIRRSGENVSPAELEQVIAQLPEVDRVAAFGVPDEERGEEIVVSIVPSEGRRVDPARVIDHCRRQLAAFKVPRYVELRDEIPMTISFRPRKSVLVDGWRERVQYDRCGVDDISSGG